MQCCVGKGPEYDEAAQRRAKIKCRIVLQRSIHRRAQAVILGERTHKCALRRAQNMKSDA